MKPKSYIYLTVYSILAGFTLLILQSCNDTIDEFTVGQNFIDSESRVVFTDAFGVELSTVWLDSLPTNMIDTLLVGNFSDEVFGQINSRGFWQMGLPAETEIQSKDIFDSITLFLSYSGYFYGDTLKPLILSFHLLTEAMELRSSGYLYNTSAFAFDEKPLAQYTFYPRPGRKDSIEFKLDPVFGQSLFELFLENDESVQDDESFVDKYPGFVIMADTLESASIIGLDMTEEKLMMKIYAHRIAEERSDQVHEFPVVYTEYAFNSIKTDFRNSELETLTEHDLSYSSDDLQNKSFAQGGTGLMTRITFPGFEEFLLLENSLILKAELILRPERTSYSEFELPEDVFLYHSDKYNNVGSLLTDLEGNYVTSNPTIDEAYHENTFYTFDITRFLRSELEDSYFDPEHAILVSFAYSEYICSLKRLVLDADAGAATLRIYYLHY
jgi:hypothetical protein